jgi:hypothetical protein
MSLLNQAQQFFAALNAHDLDTAVSMISPSANIRSPIGSFVGGEAYREWMAMQFRALPHFTHERHGRGIGTDASLRAARLRHHDRPADNARRRLRPHGTQDRYLGGRFLAIR